MAAPRLRDDAHLANEKVFDVGHCKEMIEIISLYQDVVIGYHIQRVAHILCAQISANYAFIIGNKILSVRENA